MTVLGQPNRGPCDRLGIIASRRLGGAVVRNRAKRRLREVFRRQRDAPARVTLDVVVIPRRELLTASFPSVEAEFRAALGRLRPRS
jgi:ribonuclease P protein component